MVYIHRNYWYRRTYYCYFVHCFLSWSFCPSSPLLPSSFMSHCYFCSDAFWYPFSFSLCIFYIFFVVIISCDKLLFFCCFQDSHFMWHLSFTIMCLSVGLFRYILIGVNFIEFVYSFLFSELRKLWPLFPQTGSLPLSPLSHFLGLP